MIEAAAAATQSGAATMTDVVAYTGAGGLVLSLVMWFIRKAVTDFNATATAHSSQQATRAQVDSLREEIGRLETLVRGQSEKVDRLNVEILKLRLAFVDEQSALLGILAEFNADADGDAQTKSRIAAEIEAAGRRRAAVLSGDGTN